MKISIIIPTYKPSTEYFNACIESAAHQTLNKNLYEIIIILNGPKEPYFEIIHKIINKYKASANINLIYTLKKGVSNARNIGIETAQGVFLCFLDDDDFISENYLQELLKVSNSNGISVSNVYQYYQSLDSLKDDYLTMNREVPEGILFNRKYLSNACCKLIPKSIIGNIRFNPKVEKGEDSLFMFNISPKIKQINKAKENCIYYRRMTENSVSRRRYTIWHKLTCNIKLCHEYNKIILKHPLGYNWILYLTRILATLRKII